MNWNNLESDFKNKMHERSIAPSDDSWDRLDKMLTSAEKSKPKSLLIWFSVAASIIGITFIGIYMMTQNSSLEKNDSLLVVQETKIQSDSVKSAESLKKEMVINPIISLKPSTELAEIKQSNPQKTNQAENDFITKKPAINTQEETILAENNTKEELSKHTEQFSINTKELLSSVENYKEMQSKNTSIKVNASSLLSQVDSELEQSFKEKALQSLHKNYQNLKEAIASRNIKD